MPKYPLLSSGLILLFGIFSTTLPIIVRFEFLVTGVTLGYGPIIPRNFTLALRPYIFLGCSPHQKAYKCFNPAMELLRILGMLFLRSPVFLMLITLFPCLLKMHLGIPFLNFHQHSWFHSLHQPYHHLISSALLPSHAVTATESSPCIPMSLRNQPSNSISNVSSPLSSSLPIALLSSPSSQRSHLLHPP